MSRDDELLISENDKIESILSQLKSYADLSTLAVKIIHLVEGRQDNSLESFIKNILTKSVQITSINFKPKSPWSAYLL